MAFTPNLCTTLLLLTVIVVLLPIETYAFGAGDIPDFAYLHERAFRHGDIESILETLVKNAGGVATGGGLLGFAHSMIQQAAGGAKFSKSDIKKVYFGNWLRDYSQAMDIAGLSKLTADTLVLVVSVLGFMTFSFATEEFQVTADRLGVYLPVEHIDNPKGYAAKEGDARQFHPKLRPPVDNRELEIDDRTGMKNYMATENEGWDTSTAFIRRTLRTCIEHGRRAGGQEGAELWEAYRLLGTGLHTMEDLLAHSNWCEVALRKLGHEEVFCHVGDNVIVNTPNGPAPPLITGTFGGADFIFSLMGEATDKLSQASVTDLSQRMSKASGADDEGNIANLKAVLSKLPIGGGDDRVNQGEEMHAQAKAYRFNPDDVAPPEVQKQLLDLLKWHDQVYRDVVAKIEMVPGLTELLDELSNALNAYVYTVISPYVVPILQQATGVLGEGSKAVIDSEDQFEVFNNPEASDPSHSMLSKDHFDLILNEPAGKIAQLVVQNSVNLIVQAWADDSDPDQVLDQVLEAFHHPYYATGGSDIQRQMFDHMDRWIGGIGHQQAQEIIQRLTKESVREGKNKRPGSENESHDEVGYGGHSHGAHDHGGSTYRLPISGGGGGGGDQSQQSRYGQDQYGGNRTDSSDRYGGGYQNQQSHQYGGDSGGRHRQDNTHRSSDQYGSGNQYASDNQYDSSNMYGSGHTNAEGGYGSRSGKDEYSSDNTYGGSEPHRYDQEATGYTSRRSGNDEYGQNRDERYSQSDNTHGSERRRTGYGETQREEKHGLRRSDNEFSSGDFQRYGQEDTSYSQSQRDIYVSSEGRHGHGGAQQAAYESRHQEPGGGHRDHDNDSDDERRNSREHHSRHEGGGYAPSYSQPSNTYQSSGGDYGSSRYGGGRSEDQSYKGSGNYRGEDERDRERAYGRGGNDETFGAERLRVNESDDDDDDRKSHGRHRKRDND